MSKNAEVNVTAEREASKARNAAKKAPKASAAAPVEVRRAGKPSKYAGKVIVKIAEGNPRRPGTHGARAWDSFRSGATFEEYRANPLSGLNHLDWDIRHGFVRIEDPGAKGRKGPGKPRAKKAPSGTGEAPSAS